MTMADRYSRDGPSALAVTKSVLKWPQGRLDHHVSDMGGQPPSSSASGQPTW